MRCDRCGGYLEWDKENKINFCTNPPCILADVSPELSTDKVNKTNSQQGERARTRKGDSTNVISDLPTPQSSLAINGDSNPADISSSINKANSEGEDE